MHSNEKLRRTRELHGKEKKPEEKIPDKVLGGGQKLLPWNQTNDARLRKRRRWALWIADMNGHRSSGSATTQTGFNASDVRFERLKLQRDGVTTDLSATWNGVGNLPPFLVNKTTAKTNVKTT